MRPKGPHRVVVTGMGVVTPLGSTLSKFWSNLVAGRSGVAKITLFDASRFTTQFAAEVRDFDWHRWPIDDDEGLPARKDQFGWGAAMDALDDAGLNGALRGARMGMAIGTESRRPDYFGRLAAGATYDHPADYLRNAPFALACQLGKAWKFDGPQFTITSACASGTQAVGMAYQCVQWGEADVMLAGGCDSAVDPTILAGFTLLEALSKRNDQPAAACRPFDLCRDGLVLGEGAGMLVLERLDHARARRARIYGEVLGYGASANAYRLTDQPPDGRGAYLAMKWAMEDAGVQPHEVGYVNAHGTSTPQNDSSETAALKRCFGDLAATVPVSSTKSMVGHLFTAGGAVELIVCFLTLAHGVITPTINYETPDPECDLDYVPNVARTKEVDVVLSNSSGFGGVNGAVVVGKLRERG